jgi:predicted Zn-dependent protease
MQGLKQQLCIHFQTQHNLKKSEMALVTLNKAISTNPNNPLAKFHKASILFATDKHKVSGGLLLFLSLFQHRGSEIVF